MTLGKQKLQLVPVMLIPISASAAAASDKHGRKSQPTMVTTRLDKRPLP